MDSNLSTLTYEEFGTLKAAIRLVRYLTVLAMAVAAPVVVALALPLVGWVFLGAMVLSPVVLVYVLVLAARQADLERRQATP